jgi:hypothetical protein
MADRFIHRVRLLTFPAVLRQEIAWFVNKADGSVVDWARLSLDAEGIRAWWSTSWRRRFNTW